MNLEQYNPTSEDFYVSGDDTLTKALQSCSVGMYSNDLIIASNNSRISHENIKHPLTYEDYNRLSNHDNTNHYSSTVSKHGALICDIKAVYKELGVIRNIIDLMADFASSGIKISHPNMGVQKFYRNWFERVQGRDRSERFLNNIYLFGTCLINRKMAKVSRKMKAKIRKTKASKDVKFKEIRVTKGKVPGKYTFIDPENVVVVGNTITNFVNNDKFYGIKIPHTIQHKIQNMGDAERKLMEKLGKEKFEELKDGIIPLDPESTTVYHYKKNDWNFWGTPIIESILDDAFILKKLKLADVTALDSAINPVRVWKLGSLDHKIIPQEPAFVKLRDSLSVGTGVGMKELVWTPDIELLETSVDMIQILGDDKYVPHLNAIYGGLGIPQTLTGTAQGGGGTTNNLVSLKTLIKRLEYGRSLLIEFWKTEIEIVRAAMGFARPAEIEFDLPNLGDEEAEKKLWIDLADRNYVSQEWVQEKFGAKNVIENSRLNKEDRDANNKRKVPKAGPFTNANWERDCKKLLLQENLITPSQMGIRILPPDGDEDFFQNPQKQSEIAPEENQETDIQNPGGRPRNSKDKQKRKKRRDGPVINAKMWAIAAQDKIAEELNPIILKHFNKKNLRSLSHKETELAEQMKFNTLCNIKPMQTVTEQTILSALQKPRGVYKIYRQKVNSVESFLDVNLNFDQKRNLQLEVYLDECCTD